ncbi:MAG TPA: hypothetical protein VJS66_06545 [Burkholderiales bacterium]|nr:hypothetical protein [Burkholderiales bacterium]
MRFAAFVVFASLLGACQPAFINGVPNEDSPYFEVPVDSKLVLRRQLTVPARADGVYFQRGQAMPWSAVNIYGTYCFLKLVTRRDGSQTIEPDEFAMRKVGQERRLYLGYLPSTRIQVAALGTDTMLTARVDSQGSDGYEILAAVLYLQSSRQPDVSQLACADWSIPQGHHPISVRKIRQTLGDWFDLQIAKPVP